MNKTLLLVVILLMISFAHPSSNWQSVTLIGIFAAIFLCAIIYAFAFALGIEELKIIVKNELFQVLIAGILVAGFVDFTQLLENIVTPGTSVLDEASSILNERINDVENAISVMKGIGDNLGREAMKSVTCSFGSFSFSITNCGGFYYSYAPFTVGYQIAGIALVELGALKNILNSADVMVLSFFIPFGLFLRAFNVTRGAGGVLIAIGLSIYILLPYIIVITNAVIDDVEKTTLTPHYGSLSLPSISTQECDAYSFDQSNEDKAVEQFNAFFAPQENHASFAISFLYLFLVKCTMFVVMCLAVFLGGAQALSKMFGSTVDMSMLQRLV